jgi:hypothetical protein
MKCVGEVETATQGGGRVVMAVWEQECSCGARHRLSMAKGRKPAPGTFEAVRRATTCAKHRVGTVEDVP